MMVSVFGKLKCGRVNAVAQAGWWWTVIENVAQVGTAAGTEDFRSMHTVAIVG